MSPYRKSKSETSGMKLAMVADSIITVKGAITFMASGKVVGKVDASWDFSELDPGLHGLAIQIIQGTTCHNILLPTPDTVPRSLEPAEVSKPWWRFWR